MILALFSLALFSLACVRAIDTTPDDRPADDSAEDSAEDSGPDDDERVRAIDPSQLPAGPSPCREPLLGRVGSISDGDTVYVDVHDGSAWVNLTVRLLGIDAPEEPHGGDPAECFAAESTAHLDALLDGRLVWLTFDAECEDQYDRTLAYLHRDTTDDGFINRHQARQGYAWAYPWDPPVSQSEAIEADEAAARAEGLGMWADCYTR